VRSCLKTRCIFLAALPKFKIIADCADGDAFGRRSRHQTGGKNILAHENSGGHVCRPASEDIAARRVAEYELEAAMLCQACQEHPYTNPAGREKEFPSPAFTLCTIVELKLLLRTSLARQTHARCMRNL